MGIFASRLFGPPDIRLFMVGLDAAGKTTILYKLKSGKIMKTIPTIGFNVESFQYKKETFTIWDASCQGPIRSLWKHYFSETQGLIYVVDSNDRERVQEAGEMLHELLRSDDLRDAPVLVLANKQDLKNAMITTELIEVLGLHAVKQRWHIQAVCAYSGDGLFEGLDWMTKNF